MDTNRSNLAGIFFPKPLYIVPRDNLIEEVLIPCLFSSITYDCMSGFFNSRALADLAPGLAPFISNDKSTMRLLISPHLSKEDRDAIEKGHQEPVEVLVNWLSDMFSVHELDESAISNHTLACLAYLISSQRIKIKIVLVEQGLFHPKVKIFSDGLEKVVAHGSNNITDAGLLRNVEQVSILKSWGSSEQAESIDILESEFENLWNNTNVLNALSYDIPDALANNIIKDYRSDGIPTFDDFVDAWHKDSQNKLHEDLKIYKSELVELPPDQDFQVPEYLQYKEGDFSHQGNAIDAWEEVGRRGILQMATGSGKTITSLICAHRIYESTPNFLIVVAAPYLPLILQWAKEAANFGLKPIIPGDKNRRDDKLSIISKSVRNLDLGIKDVQILVVTNNMLMDPEFNEIIASHGGMKLLIADEVHHLGTRSFLGSTPDMFDYRLGLSATPVRQYDDDGTEGLFSFFGPVAYEYGLDEAIGKCLVPYNYYIHPIDLNNEEAEEWLKISNKIKKMSAYNPEGFGSGDGTTDQVLTALLNKRRKIIEQAQNKIATFQEIFGEQSIRDVKHTLVYTSDKYREQLEQINDMLLNVFKIRMHQLTAEETSSGLAKSLLLQFAVGKIQAITAMRVLDEGVDIPEVSTAYILASTTVMRQWVQRRGRVLRKCSTINKQSADIHDFLVLPPYSDDLKSIIAGELSRALEFARLASNGYGEAGIMRVISDIMDRYHLR